LDISSGDTTATPSSVSSDLIPAISSDTSAATASQSIDQVTPLATTAAPLDNSSIMQTSLASVTPASSVKDIDATPNNSAYLNSYNAANSRYQADFSAYEDSVNSHNSALASYTSDYNTMKQRMTERGRLEDFYRDWPNPNNYVAANYPILAQPNASNYFSDLPTNQVPSQAEPVPSQADAPYVESNTYTEPAAYDTSSATNDSSSMYDYFGDSEEEE